MFFSFIRRNISIDVRVQEAAINVFSTIKKYLDDDTMTKLLLPKAKSLFTKSSAVRVSITYLYIIMSKMKMYIITTTSDQRP